MPTQRHRGEWNTNTRHTFTFSTSSQLLEIEEEESLDDIASESGDEDDVGQVYSFRNDQADDDVDIDVDDMAVSHGVQY